MEKKNYSQELQRLITFMETDMTNEMPTVSYTLEYFILAILQQRDSFIYKRLDDNLTTMTMDTLFNAYYQLVQQKRVNGVRPQREIKYDPLFTAVLEEADGERRKMGDKKITSEHVFLAILNNKSADNKVKKIFNKAGVEYNILLSKINASKNLLETPTEDTDKPEEPQQPNNIIMGVDLGTGSSKTAMITFINGTPPMPDDGRRKGKTPVDTYCINVNHLAEQGKIDRLVGREKEIESIVRVMGRRKKNNVILVGEGGAGKTCIAEGLAFLILDGSAPNILADKTIVELDMTSLIAGTTLRGMFEERVKKLLDEIKNNKKYILLIDNISAVLDSRSGENEFDIASMLSHSMENGDLQVIGTTDFKGYRNTFDKNPSLGRKFQKIVIDPPTKEESIEIINTIKTSYENYHNVIYSPEAINACVELSQKYITERNLPDSALDILDEVGSLVNIKTHNTKEITELRIEITNLKNKILELKMADKYDEADNLAKQEKKLSLKLNEELRKLEDNIKKNGAPIITVDVVTEVISNKTGIPISKLTVDDKRHIASINERIKEEVIGQDEAIDAICRAIKRNRVGLKNGKTYGTFLCIGKSGVGKTLLAKKLAKEMFGDEDAMIRFDMSEYSDKTSVNKLIGASAGYVGYDEGGVMTEQVKNKKHCVILLDEIEKADADVYNLFLQVFDEGFLTDNTGQKVDFKNTIIILTSNVGTKAAAMGKGIGFGDDDNSYSKNILNKELKKKFPPEFLNRLDDIIYFNDLKDDDLSAIVDLEMKKLQKRAESVGFTVTYDESALRHILDIIKPDKEFGARPILRAIEHEYEDKITDMVLSEDYTEHNFVITVKNKKVSIV